MGRRDRLVIVVKAEILERRLKCGWVFINRVGFVSVYLRAGHQSFGEGEPYTPREFRSVALVGWRLRVVATTRNKLLQPRKECGGGKRLVLEPGCAGL